MRIVTTALVAALACGAAGCTQHETPHLGAAMPNGATAIAMLRTADGADVGRATATEVAGGLRLSVDVKGMPAGTHGAHVHTTGRCDIPDFTTAGGHWNPSGAKHGAMNAGGPHMGDLPNLIVATDGRGTVAATIPGATMAGLLDADGSVLIVHANADDMMTDPSGNSGARIACGVFGAS